MKGITFQARDLLEELLFALHDGSGEGGED